MPPRSTGHLLLILPLVVCAGCSTFSTNEGSADLGSLLQPAAAFDDSVTLEIYFARYSAGDELNRKLWSQVDEQQISSAARRQLTRNGMRAGIIGAQVPEALADLMQLSERLLTEEEKSSGVPLDVQPRVSKRLLQLRFGNRGEIVASPVIDELSLLMNEDGVLAGQTFRQAQPLFAATAQSGDGKQIRLSLTPEIHHGQPQQQWTGQDGIMRLDMSRDREVFRKLQIEGDLSPGQILLVGSLPKPSGSLGHHFFTEESADGRVPKLLIVRAVQTPAQDVFAGPHPPGNGQ